MQGIYVDFKRPRSKKAVKDAVADNPARVSIEGTSMRGDDYDGALTGAPTGQIHFVGPDPYRERKFYGTLTVKADGTFSVK